MTVDCFGARVQAGASDSVEAWDAAWREATHFVGAPFDTLAPANLSDDDFALGSVFCGVYRVLGGAHPDSPEVAADVARAAQRSDSDRERGHLEALELLVAGEFTAAAKRWDQVNRDARDFAAVRFAHDAYLHVGNDEDRLQSSASAVDDFGQDPGWNLVASQYAFALEEAGKFDEAERTANLALDADPLDLWATHALAHVFVHTERHDDSLELLRSRQDTWSKQDGLSTHIWWHLVLHLIARKEFDEVLSIHDSLVETATTPFRLCDLISLLWRLELAGVDVGSRWEDLADALARRPERHTSGFLDLHSALTFSRLPSHPETEVFFDGLETARHTPGTENERTFDQVVRPLAHAIRNGSADPAAAKAELDRLAPNLHSIGGSNAQRDIVTRTAASFDYDPKETVL